MVSEKEITKYACPFCSSEYYDEQEAEDCLEECNEATETVYQVEGVMFICDMCKSEHNKEEDAKFCESKHMRKADLFYQEYIDAKNKKPLEDAAKHPSQSRLNSFEEEK